MLRTVKPKNARSKRALKEREAKIVENPKTAIFVRGNQTSQVVQTALAELLALKKPDGIAFSKKNDIHPFEDHSSLEFWADKNDASLFCVGLHSKKRPHDLVFARMFDGQLLDMLEVGIESAKSMTEFSTGKPAVAMKPFFTFTGDLFDTHTLYQQFKSTILDFFVGAPLASFSLHGCSHVIALTTSPLPATSSTLLSTELPTSSLPAIHFRVYTISLLKSGQRTPRVELTECGPALDFKLRRHVDADEGRMKAALKRAKDPSRGQGKKVKNVEVDEMGDKVGRIHMERQDLGQLQTRKMKGLKRGEGAMDLDAEEEGARAGAEEEEEYVPEGPDGVGEVQAAVEAAEGRKKRRKA